MLNRISHYAKSQGLTDTEIDKLIANLNELPNGLKRFFDDINHRNSLRRVRNTINQNNNNTK